MGTDDRPGGAARSIVSIGHLLVGAAALIFAGVLIVAGSDPLAELGTLLLPQGLLLVLVAGVFTYTAVMVLRRAPEDRRGPSLILSIIELAVGAALVAGLVAAVQSYGVFAPWHSPLLLPSVLLVALGLTGLGLEIMSGRASTPEMH
jgi:hypothetical protein